MINNDMRALYYPLILLFLLFTLEGCTILGESHKSQCIPPNDVSGYQPDLYRPDTLAGIPSNRAMPTWWHPQLDEAQIKQLIRTDVNKVVFREKNEIWIAYNADDSGNSVIRYQTDTGEVSLYRIVGANGKGFNAGDLIVTRDGNLWAKFFVLLDFSYYSFLAHYDSQQNQFQVVSDQNGWLTYPNNIETYWNGRPQPALGEMPDGRLAVEIGGMIYLYDIAKNLAVPILKEPNVFKVNSITVSATENIWFITTEDLSIRILHTLDGSISNYGPPPNITGEKKQDFLSQLDQPLAMDEVGRLWVDDYGWLELDDYSNYKWHPVDRSTLFIYVYDPDLKYVWLRPRAVYRLSDKSTWFWAGTGIVQYDDLKNIWCWKAPEGGPLVEGMSGDLWLIGQHQIYKYRLTP